MYIMLDSNIWFSELGLSTAKGAALQFFAKQQSATIAIPEVIKREVEFNTRSSLKKYCDDIEKNQRQLLSIFGNLKEVVLPSDQDIEECVKGLFDKVSAKTIHIPFCLESASQSLTKVIVGSPPSGPKNQQFKDGVIWADCLGLLEQDDVVLVTNDKAFYQGGDYGKGLAANLKQEADERPKDIRILPDLTNLLEKIKTPIQIDKSLLTTEFCKQTNESYTNILGLNGFEITGEPEVNVSLFVTENADQLYIEFSITFDCNDTTDEDRTKPKLIISGDAFYQPRTSTFAKFRNQGEELSFIDANGEQQSKNAYKMFGNIVMGHRNIEHVVRRKIE